MVKHPKKCSSGHAPSLLRGAAQNQPPTVTSASDRPNPSRNGEIAGIGLGSAVTTAALDRWEAGVGPRMTATMALIEKVVRRAGRGGTRRRGGGPPNRGLGRRHRGCPACCVHLLPDQPGGERNRLLLGLRGRDVERGSGPQRHRLPAAGLPPAVIVRAATASDSPAIADVVEAVYEEYGFAWDAAGCQADLYDIGAHYLDRGHHVWAACEGSVVVGTIGLKVFDPLAGPLGAAVALNGAVRLGGCDSSVTRLYVNRDARRCGTGTHLLSTALEEARARCGAELSKSGATSASSMRSASTAVSEPGLWPIGFHDPDLCVEAGLVIDLAG